LRHACERFGFPVDEIVLADAEKILRENGDGFARIYVTAGDGAVTDAVAQPRVFVFIEPREPVTGEVYARGYALAISHEPYRALFGGLKTANYWTNAHALGVARAHNRDEALLFNEPGELVSACMANVFIARAGKIATPPLECGARDGVVRAWVSARREVKQRHLTRADLAGADEIFLTNSWLGVMPVASLDDRRLRSTSIAAGLRADYERECLG
jgi:branched-subunit amino acid aminotransferase/4-amino-4-deoxychorismate lyase